MIYEHDRVADQAAKAFNVTWNRTTPIVVGLLDGRRMFSIVTGEMNHRMGMDVEGSEENVKLFRFMSSLSFPLAEQWVMKALFPGTSLNGAIPDLINSYSNGNPLEIISDGRYIIIREVKDNVTNILLLDLETGLLRDLIGRNSSFSGAYCYSDQQTEWGWNYG